MGFTQSETDPCLLTHAQKKLTVLVYVDDIAVAAPTTEPIQWFKREFGKVFKIKDLGEVQKILGVRVTRDRRNRTLRLDQTHYVKDVLEKFHMAKEKAHPTHSPMDSYEALQKSGPQDLRTDRTEYQKLIGHWMYLGILTRPDAAFALGRLSQYLADPSEKHAHALKKLSKYLRSSMDLGITFSAQGNTTIEGYSDSDYAMDKADRTSILGYVFMLGGAPVS